MIIILTLFPYIILSNYFEIIFNVVTSNEKINLKCIQCIWIKYCKFSLQV